MQLDHSFTVPVPVDEAWSLFHDIARIAPCMPGAVLDSAGDGEFAGRVKVKAGAVQMSYRGAGTAAYDESARTVALQLSGSETRGAGTASAAVTAALEADGAGTRVRVRTELDLTGRPAQFGRGILVEVGDRLVGTFADNLAALLSAPAASPAAAPAAAAPAADPEPLDLGAAVLPALARRAAAPAAAVAAFVAGLLVGRYARHRRAA